MKRKLWEKQRKMKIGNYLQQKLYLCTSIDELERKEKRKERDHKKERKIEF
jgi:hypothetical protein